MISMKIRHCNEARHSFYWKWSFNVITNTILAVISVSLKTVNYVSSLHLKDSGRFWLCTINSVTVIDPKYSLITSPPSPSPCKMRINELRWPKMAAAVLCLIQHARYKSSASFAKDADACLNMRLQDGSTVCSIYFSD